jgi:putative ABC transport system permease protein
VIVGVVAGRVVTGLYTGAIDVPDTVTGFHVGTIVAGLALAACAGALAATQPAVAAARTDPAAALGGITPVGRGGRSLVERVAPPLRRLPARWRMVLRGIGRDPRRSVSTIVGVVLAMVLILASWGMIDTVEVLLAEQFDEVQRQDAQVYVATDAEDAAAAIRRVPGVERAETVGQATVVIGHDDFAYATELVAFDPSTEMHGFGSTGPPTSGIVAGRSLASLLDVDVGDVVTISAPGAGGTVIRLPVEGFVDEPLGTFVYAEIASVEGVVDGPDTTTVMIRFAPDVEREEMRRSITAVDGVVAYVDSRALYDTAQSLLGLFYAFVGVMLAFGALMAFALIFATASANASERSAELASMRVNGMSSDRLTHLLDGENLLLTSVAILPGLAIGWMVSSFLMDSFSSDLFDFSLHMRPRTLVITAAAALVVGAMAHWPVSRLIARLDLARVVRERSR